MPYKKNQLKGIKKTFQNNIKVIDEQSSLAIIRGSFFLDGHLKAKLRKEY